MEAASSRDETRPYRSPKRSLAHSFRLSRDRWKQKATQRRRQVKALQVKARDLEASRELWKARALAAEAQLQQPCGPAPSAEPDQPGPAADSSPPAAPTALPDPPATAAAPGLGAEKKTRRTRRLSRPCAARTTP
jgi:hypothetical protein